MAINARGPFLCYKYAAQQMIKQGRGGRIIGASSVIGKRGIHGASAYSASKFAVRGLTQTAGKARYFVILLLNETSDRTSTGTRQIQHYGELVRSWSYQDAHE